VRALWVLVLVVAASGCDVGPRACTAMGAFQGVTVEFPEPVALREGYVALEVCDDDGCAEIRQSIGRIRAGTPAARSFSVGFDALQRTFGPGTVSASAEVIDARGATVARGSGPVELTTNYPNGRECASDGVSGTLALGADDLVGR
jgi:hypothetical protein